MARICPALLVPALLAVCAAASVACRAPQRVASPDRRLVSDAYVLFSPLLSTTTYLVDRDGRVVHT